MNLSSPHALLSRCHWLLVPLCAVALLGTAGAAPPARDTGTITGVVANAATQQFLQNAEAKVDGTNLSDVTDRDGGFELRNVPAGPHTLTVTYLGLQSETREVAVEAGKTIHEDFNLTSNIYKMEKFVVAGEAEGNAAELNRQRRATVLMNSVSADALGVVPQGNIGEFLKYMPGLQVNYSDGEATTVSVRGQDPESTVFMFDGQIPAAAGLPPRSASGSSDASSRAFEFTQASIDNIESIEFFKAPPPWMPPATGGVVNAVTKNAFEQKGRRLTAIATLNANDEMLSLGAKPGPGERPTERIKPGGRLNYSESFFHNTFGLALSLGASSVITPNHDNAMLYMPFVAGTTTAPVDYGVPEYVNSFTNIDGPSVKTRRNVGLNTDYRLGANTVLKFNAGYNYYLQQTRQHTFRVRAVVAGSGPRSTLAPNSDTTDTTVSDGQVDVFANYSDYLSQNYSARGAVEHRWGPWRVDYGASYAKSDSKVTDLPNMINSIQVGLDPTQHVGWHIEASPGLPAPTVFTQTNGPDLYDLGSYNTTLTKPIPGKPGTAPSTAPQAGGTGIGLQTAPRWQNDRTTNLNLDIRRVAYLLNRRVEFRAGSSLYRMARRKSAGQIILWYAGPDGIPFSGDELLNAGQFAMTSYGDKFLYGLRQPPLLDPYKVAAYMKQYPLAFQDLEPGNIQRQALNSQNLTQDITAGYAAATAQVTPKLTLVGGVRTEETENFARGAIRINSLGNGLIVNSIEWNRAIYSQTQRVTDRYRDYFPNLQATYRFTPNFLFRGAISKSMSRPGVQTILPNTTVNDTASTPSVTVNNTALKPTYSHNIDLQLEFYTHPSGSISLGWFSKSIDNYIINETTTIDAGTDNGFDGQYAGYLLRTQSNGGKGHFQGLELSARQQLSPILQWAPEVLRGWEVFANYTRNYKGEAPNRAGILTKPMAPDFYDWNANYGISYTSPRRTWYAQVRTVIYPSAMTIAPSTTDLRPTYEARHQRWDATLRYRLSQRYAFELTAANIFGDPWMDRIKAGRHIERREYGATYALSFIADFW